ncbi:DNA repair protein Rad26 [Diaporthe helianthi]|uniref:DNA repair protein Rad26 n=1 Tax=Diaporthe helianthi TaxID=158607 RepID=A0A2P5HUN2_DIAHE|nr:DNA repair protein Rad26 [Diaporthe helianthi]
MDGEMDDFSDDGFDDLNVTALQELENNAIQMTQAQQLGPTQPLLVKDDDYGLEDDDLDDTVVIDEAAQLPVRPSVERERHSPAQAPSLVQDSSALQPARLIQQPRWQQPATGPVPSQYQPARLSASSSSRPVPPRPMMPHHMGPPPPAPSTANRLAPRPTHTQYTGTHQPPPPPAPAPTPHPHPPPPSRPTYPQDQASQQPPTAIQQNRDAQFAALQARVRALENDLHSARGEASIVRSKYERSVATHEAEVSRLKKQNAEALAKQERLVEAAVHAEKAAATELQFTRQDLRDELQKSKKGRKESTEAIFSTPRKSKANSSKNIADGFDDVEILPSPSKAQGGLKGKGKGAILAPGERTPSRAKRKRPAVDSPVTALEVEDDSVMADADADAAPAPAPAPAPASATQYEAPGSSLRPSALPYDLLRLVLDHGAIHGQPLTFDLLARYSFPSDSEQSFAGIIFQRLPSLGDAHDPVRLLIDFCEMIIDLWNQCIQEKYYEPIYELVALITFILQLNTISVAPYVTSTLVPLAQTTIFLLAVPRFESQDGALASNPDETIQHLVLNIDTEGTLQLMYLAALGCTDSYLLDPQHPLDLGPDRDSPQRLYWKLMRIDFVLLMLSPKQPRDDFLGMLSLLCTSCLADSIGPITSEPDRDPVFVAQALIERVSKIMHEPRSWAAPGELSGSFGHRQCVVRLAALRTLMAFAQSGLGARQLGLSDVAIPRLVNVLCGVIDALYDMDVPVELIYPVFDQDEDDNDKEHEKAQQEKPPADSEMMEGVDEGTADRPIALDEDDTEPEPSSTPNQSSQTPLDPSPTPLLYKIASSVILLLHTLVTDPATSAHTDMRAKLSTSHGAPQKYLLTLSRLNYAEEDLVLEAGIDQGTLDRANELLDLAITPEEAEGVRQVFGA